MELYTVCFSKDIADEAALRMLQKRFAKSILLWTQENDSLRALRSEKIYRIRLAH